MARNDEQLVMRRVYDANNVLIREGLVSKDVPNTRQALLEFWAAQDEADAQAEADAAAAEAQRLEALQQEPVNGEAMAIPGLMAAVEQQGALLAELDQRTSVLVAAQPDEVLRASLQLQLAAGAAQAVEATAQQAQGELKAIAEAAQERLDSLASDQAESLGRVADAVEWGRQQVERTSAQVEADAKRRVAQLVTTTTAQIADKRGPKGATGAPGTSFAIVPDDPNKVSAEALANRFRRAPIIGDTAAQQVPEGLLLWVLMGESWEQSALVPADIRVESRPLAISDHSTKVFPTMSTAAGGGSGGSLAADPVFLPASSVQPNASVLIGDSSRWQAGGSPEFRSGVVALQIVPADGPFGGGTHFVEAAFVVVAGGSDPFRFSEGFALGRGVAAGDLKVDLSGQMGPATAPGSLGVTLPPGTANACRIWVTITAPAPPAGASRYFVSGRIEWSPAAATGAAPANSLLVKSPAWALI
jgi:hypothetical protein